MRDPRFPSRSTFWSDVASQAQVVAGEMWGAPLVDVLFLVLRESQYWETQRRFSLSTSFLADRLTSLGVEGITVPEEIISGLAKSFDSQADSPISAQAAWCWGLALGRVASEVCTARELHILLDCARPNPVMAEALYASVARMISKKQPGVVAAVREEVDRLLEVSWRFRSR